MGYPIKVTIKTTTTVSVIEDQSRNGVKVLVHHGHSGTSVETDCQCFGTDFRAHSNEHCVNRKRQLKEAE